MVKSIFDAQSYSPDNLTIEAWLKKDGLYKKARVEASRIAYRTDNEDGTSSIVLADGKEILTTLTLDQLDERISSHSFKDGNMINLKPFSGKAIELRQAEISKAKERLDLEQLAAEFNIKAQRGEGLQVGMYVFEDKDGPLIKVLIPVDAITRYEQDLTYGHKDEWAFIAGDGIKSFFFFMPIEKFQQRIAEAKASRHKFLNLLEETKAPPSEKRAISPKPQIFS
jgi:hypothetical protein